MSNNDNKTVSNTAVGDSNDSSNRDAAVDSQSYSHSHGHRRDDSNGLCAAAVREAAVLRLLAPHPNIVRLGALVVPDAAPDAQTDTSSSAVDGSEWSDSDADNDGAQNDSGALESGNDETDAAMEAAPGIGCIYLDKHEFVTNGAKRDTISQINNTYDGDNGDATFTATVARDL